MKHRRLAAAAAMAALLSLQSVGTAVAEPPPSEADLTLGRMLPGDCAPFVPTADGDIPGAWHLDRLQMDAVWRIATGDGITVAVIDTGVSSAPTPFFPRDEVEKVEKVTAYDFLGKPSEEDPDASGMDCAHGTEVAALIAAARPGGRQVDPRTNFAGIAPDARIISYRVLSKSLPDGQDGDPLAPTIEAVRHATEAEVDVINLSQSASRHDASFEDFRSAVQEALDKGIVVVAAAGNVVPGDPPPEPSYPGAFDGVIAVGATKATDAISETSQPGDYISVGAPGTNITTLLPSKIHQMPAHTNQAYAEGLTGTSFAAPIVSGVVALMLEQNPSLTPIEVREILEATADPPPSTAPDSRIGFGIVNPTRALAGNPRPMERNPAAGDITVPLKPLPTAEDPDMTPAVVAVSVGAGALALVSVGLVAAISIPAATRRNRQQSSLPPRTLE